MDPNLPRFTRYPPSSAADPPAAAPPRAAHRRAHSETFVRLPDDFLFDSDPDFGLADIDFPSLSDDTAADRTEPPAPQVPATAERGAHHLRSLSVDAAFFEGLGFQMGAPSPAQDSSGKKPHHRHSSSMDGYTSPLEAESSAASDYAKKAMAADKLAELSLIDPKRAKRILANRQSAARSKERKIRYTSELERKVQTLQTEATTLSAQLTLLQRDTTGLTAENKELKLRLQAMEQQAHLRDAINEALREEVQRLKLATGQVPNVNGNAFGRGFQQAVPQFLSQPQLHNPGGHQAQQLYMSRPPPNGQPLGSQSMSDSMDFM